MEVLDDFEEIVEVGIDEKVFGALGGDADEW